LDSLIINPGISDGPSADKEMTQEKLSQTGYIINNNRIESLTLSEYLRSYYSDMTTSPRGVEPKLFVEEN